MPTLQYDALISEWRKSVENSYANFVVDCYSEEMALQLQCGLSAEKNKWFNYKKIKAWELALELFQAQKKEIENHFTIIMETERPTSIAPGQIIIQKRVTQENGASTQVEELPTTNHSYIAYWSKDAKIISHSFCSAELGVLAPTLIALEKEKQSKNAELAQKIYEIGKGIAPQKAKSWSNFFLSKAKDKGADLVEEMQKQLVSLGLEKSCTDAYVSAVTSRLDKLKVAYNDLTIDQGLTKSDSCLSSSKNNRERTDSGATTITQDSIDTTDSCPQLPTQNTLTLAKKLEIALKRSLNVSDNLELPATLQEKNKTAFRLWGLFGPSREYQAVEALLSEAKKESPNHVQMQLQFHRLQKIYSTKKTKPEFKDVATTLAEARHKTLEDKINKSFRIFKNNLTGIQQTLSQDTEVASTPMQKNDHMPYISEILGIEMGGEDDEVLHKFIKKAREEHSNTKREIIYLLAALSYVYSKFQTSYVYSKFQTSDDFSVSIRALIDNIKTALATNNQECDITPHFKDYSPQNVGTLKFRGDPAKKKIVDAILVLLEPFKQGDKYILSTPPLRPETPLSQAHCQAPSFFRTDSSAKVKEDAHSADHNDTHVKFAANDH